jgi:uncharacterized membrane protein
MNDIDGYVGQVKRRLWGVDARMRADILAELGNHLSDAVADAGGDASVALSGLQSPKELARHYREIYGYGTPFKVMFAVLAAVLAVPTVYLPQMSGFQAFDPVLIPSLFLLVAVVYLIWISVAAGKVVGAACGAVACIVRLATLGALLTGGGALVDSGGLGLAGFVATSLALILVGYLPGERKEKWVRGEVTL